MNEQKDATVTDQPHERHPLDLFSLLAGVVFLGIGAALMLTESTLDSDADLGWVVAVLLIGLGLAGALGSIVRRRPRAIDGGALDEQSIDQEKEVSP
jgi:hypothetical protein